VREFIYTSGSAVLAIRIAPASQLRLGVRQALQN